MISTGTIASKPADETEPEDELARHEGAERISGVAADVEVRHAARALRAARVLGELRALGMKSRDTETAGEYEQEHERIHRRDGRSADTDGGERDTAGDQPERSWRSDHSPKSGCTSDDESGGREQQHRRERVARGRSWSVRNGIIAGTLPDAKSTARWPPDSAAIARLSIADPHACSC